MSTSPVSRSPILAVLVLQAPIADKDSRRVTDRAWTKWFSNITLAVNSGLALDGTAIKLAYPAIGVKGGVEATLPADHQWVNQIDAFGVPQLSQPDFSDLSGEVATAQLPFTVTSGSGAPASTPADGSFYFDTSASPAHGYVRLSSAWVQFS
jgi:hypothetical protein